MFLASGFAGQILELDGGGRVLAAMGSRARASASSARRTYMALGVNDDIYVADTVKPALHKFIKQ